MLDTIDTSLGEGLRQQTDRLCHDLHRRYSELAARRHNARLDYASWQQELAAFTNQTIKQMLTESNLVPALGWAVARQMHSDLATTGSLQSAEDYSQRWCQETNEAIALLDC